MKHRDSIIIKDSTSDTTSNNNTTTTTINESNDGVCGLPLCTIKANLLQCGGCKRYHLSSLLLSLLYMH